MANIIGVTILYKPWRRGVVAANILAADVASVNVTAAKRRLAVA